MYLKCIQNVSKMNPNCIKKKNHQKKRAKMLLSKPLVLLLALFLPFAWRGNNWLHVILCPLFIKTDSINSFRDQKMMYHFSGWQKCLEANHEFIALFNCHHINWWVAFYCLLDKRKFPVYLHNTIKHNGIIK